MIRCSGRPRTYFSYASRARNIAVNRPLGITFGGRGAHTAIRPASWPGTGSAAGTCAAATGSGAASPPSQAAPNPRYQELEVRAAATAPPQPRLHVDDALLGFQVRIRAAAVTARALPLPPPARPGRPSPSWPSSPPPGCRPGFLFSLESPNSRPLSVVTVWVRCSTCAASPATRTFSAALSAASCAASASARIARARHTAASASAPAVALRGTRPNPHHHELRVTHQTRRVTTSPQNHRAQTTRLHHAAASPAPQSHGFTDTSGTT